MDKTVKVATWGTPLLPVIPWTSLKSLSARAGVLKKKSLTLDL